MRIYTSILCADNSSTRGRSYRAAAAIFAQNASAEEIAIGRNSILQADVEDLDPFLAALDDAITNLEGQAIIVSTPAGIHVVGDPTYGPLALPFDNADAGPEAKPAEEFDPLAGGM